MKQVLQNLGSGETMLAEVPAPRLRGGSLLIRSRSSLVSIGTERMLINFGKSGWIEKARQQPEKVKMVLQKIRTDGLLPTIDAVRAKLDQPIALGYANAGVVIDAANEASGAFSVGQRVVSNGPHAEVVCVPKNLCARIPDNVSDEEAAFTVVAAIGLQGIRLLQPTLGETFVVTGLGLIGLLCVQLLRAHGCRVLGVDFDSSKCALARQFGAEAVDLSRSEDLLARASAFSGGRGVDGVLIAASTHSNEPVHQAALMCRKRGRIVLVGVTGLELSRADFYEKELSFQVSCSYGPGRYDENYEQQGNDYPIGFVRWTEQRNFEAVLELMSSGELDVQPLITHRFRFEEALQAYEGGLDRSAMGIVLDYDALEASPALGPTVATGSGDARPRALPGAAPVIGVVGAGSFTGQVLLPALQRTGVRLKSIASGSGVTGTHLAKKFGFENSTTDSEAILSDEEIDTVLITTRHDTHARLVRAALEAGKRVYVEKPLCLTASELQAIVDAYHAASNPFLMVGFNRRFAPHTRKAKELLDTVRGPKVLMMTVNAGFIPADHWTQDRKIGGGRIIGEGCHFIELARYLVGSEICSVHVAALRQDEGQVTSDTGAFTLSFGDGSFATIHYLANGNKGFPKERLEIFCDGRILQFDNFRQLRGFGWPKFKKDRLWSQDKGHRAEMRALVAALTSGAPSPTPFDEIIEVTRASFEIDALARGARTTSLSDDEETLAPPDFVAARLR